MSGAEVVGLVLGAIPLLICGLEHYAEGIHVIRTMWNYEAVMNHLVAEFTLAQGIFRHSCQDLLMPILPDSQAAELLEGGSPHWENPALDQQLRASLGPDYQVYTRNVTRLRRQIDLFTRKLGLDVETRMPPWISDAKVDKAMRDRFFRDTWRKIRGGFDTSRVETLLADILRNIDQITKFTRGSIAIAPKRIALRRHTNSRYWIKIRDHARRLFDSLSSRWSCACSDLHCASLRLDTSKSSAIHDEKDIRLGVLFSFGQKSATKSPDLPPWSWREVDIQPLPIVRKQTTMAIATPLTSAKRVSFSIQSPSRSAAALPASQPSLVSVPEISDLCSVMKHSTKNAGCIGYLEGHDYRQYLHMTARDAHVDGGRELVRLYDVLPRKGTYSLGVKDRYGLALTIASAVLQLHATPWLRAQWCLNDIHFARGSESGPLASRTFVTKTFASPNCRQQSMDLNQQPTLGAYTCVANESIFTLGVALIEISFGVPILELKESADPDIPGFLEFFIATRLVNNNVIKERDHDKYAEVVLRCVKCQLNTLVTPLSLEDVKVQQSFYEDVIFPLQQLNDTLHDGASASTLTLQILHIKSITSRADWVLPLYQPEVATIDPSSSPPPLLNRPASRRGPTPSTSAHSTPRPASRRSEITSQIYQFALGYPQTPPETSPDLDPFRPSIDVESSGGGNSMGSFLFRWDHPASEVYVTGTFDDWARSVKLERKAGRFERLVELPLAQETIYYKFVVDGNWTTDHTAPQESDDSNNINNVLLPENITRPHSISGPAAAGMMSGVTPHSTTVGLASSVPKESERAEREDMPASASSDIPGSFPETPFHDASEFTVDPIPASSGIGNPVNLQPGDRVPHHSNFTENTVDSNVATDKESYEKAGGADDSERTFGVAPIPATSGAGNPISLQPGDKVPHHSEFTSNTIGSNVTTDKESYEKAGTVDVSAPYKAGGVSRDMSSMPPVSGTMIPESSLPMGEGAGATDPGYTIQSAGANSTTTALAGKVPLEPRGVPTVVSESQREAGVGPEASSNREAVREKTAMEKELESKVPEEPATTEGVSGSTASTKDKDAESATGIGAVVAGGAAAGAYASSSSHGLPASIQQSIDEMNKGSLTTTPIAPTVPDVVQESITESHQSPEAAGSKTMVAEKSAMEKDLLSRVPKEDNVGEPAPSSTAALTETAPTATGSENSQPKKSAPVTTGSEDYPAKEYPPVTTGSEDYPAKEYPPITTGSENPPPKDSAPITTAAAPAQTPAAQNSMKQAIQFQPDSRDISPMSKPINPEQTQPTVTTGVGSSYAPPKSETPAQAAAASAAKSSSVSNSSAATDKKAKRSSFFGKLKSKFSDKDKK